MKRKINEFLQTLNSYRVLLWIWFVIGTLTMILGDISRVSYGCVWALLMMEYVARARKE